MLEIVYVLGLACFLAGIAGGMLIVFGDRHGYERSVPLVVVVGLICVGLGLVGLSWVLQYVGG